MLIKYVELLRKNLLPKKQIIINAIILFTIAFLLLLFDQLFKNLLFNNDEYKSGFINNGIEFDFKVIGFRPLLHHGVTSGLQKVFGFWLIHFFSVIMILVAIVMLFFLKDRMLLVAISILLAGNLGNMLDRILYNNSVKDILFLPFYDNGTFNFADVFIITGALLIPLTMFGRFLLTTYKSKKAQKNQDLTIKE